jgi:hypothetical protein
MRKLAIVFILACNLILVSTCGKQQNPLAPANPKGATVDISKANQALEKVLFDLLNRRDDIQHPKEIDFTTPYNLYRDAYTKDPTNLDANFGLAVTNILMLTQDAELQKAFDEWDAYLKNNTPFEAPLSGKRGNFKLGFPVSISYFDIPERALAKTIIGTQIMAVTAAPKLSAVQKILETKLLPKLDLALQALDRIDDNRNYKFIITPKMQGDVNEDSLEIDLTEIYAFEVSLNALRAAVDIAIAYNVEFTDYDSAGLVAALRPGSAFMTLRNNGATLAQAKSSLLSAVDKLEAGITFLRQEKDPQFNDIIKIGHDDVDRADLDSIMAHIDDARNILTKTYTHTDDWDGNGSTPDQPLSVSFGSFFDKPIVDFKAIFPLYTVKAVRDTIDYNYNYFSGNSPVSTTITVSNSGSYYFNRYDYWDADWPGYSYFSNNITIPKFDQEFDRIKQTLRANPNVYYIDVSLYWSGSYGPGTHNISGNIEFYYGTRTPELAIYVPEITWQANNFGQWIFLNPSLNGILPGMTDAKFKQTFGITANQWKKTFRFDLDEF